VGEEAGGRMAGKSSNRARRRHLPDTVEILPEWERELLLEQSRREITELNRKNAIAQKSRAKKKKMPKVQMAHKKGQSPLQPHGA
jgi:hypothetical protein